MMEPNNETIMRRKTPASQEFFSDGMQNMMAKNFAALGDPKRLRIIGMLTDHACDAAELKTALGCSTGNLWTHLSILKGAGFVSLRRDGIKAIYYLTDTFAGDLMSLVLEQVRERQAARALAVG